MKDPMHSSRRRRGGSAALVLLLAAGLALSACDRGAASSGPLPNIAPVVPSTTPPPLAMAMPASGIALRDASPGGRPGDGSSTHGAETSPGTGAGPGNASTAVGGQAGGQATGGGTGGTPAPTAGDGGPPK